MAAASKFVLSLTDPDFTVYKVSLVAQLPPECNPHSKILYLAGGRSVQKAGSAGDILGKATLDGAENGLFEKGHHRAEHRFRHRDQQFDSTG